MQISGDPNIWPRPPLVDDLIQNNAHALSNPLTLATHIEDLINTCRSNHISIDQLSLISLTCLEINTIALREHYGFGWFEEQPSETALINMGWRLMGFDILDLRGLISGLSGCGKISEIPFFQNYLSKTINKFGLFKTYRSASEFSEVRGLQIYNHAPFIPIGILIKN
ncbi:hypothetical protein [Nitrosospira multiformis]|nr:hypothetical protein [Nitrosospira multiformis]